MNSVVLMGRLTRDPELREGATTVCRFGIAVDRRGKQDEADFFNCVAFGKTGEALARYMGKGRRVVLSGRVQNDNYTDHNGVKKQAVTIVVSEWEFADSKKDQQEAPAADFMAVPADGLEELPFN